MQKNGENHVTKVPENKPSNQHKIELCVMMEMSKQEFIEILARDIFSLNGLLLRTIR